jgi:hypothetical protein
MTENVFFGFLGEFVGEKVGEKVGTCGRKGGKLFFPLSY